MKEDKRRFLARIAYMHYIEGKSQTRIAKEMGIYRTTICRMLAKAKDEGILKVEIKDFDVSLFALEAYVKDKYGLEKIDIIPQEQEDDDHMRLMKVARAAAELVRRTVKDGDQIGIAWGSTLSHMIDQSKPRSLKGVKIRPLAGGPSHIHAKFHVNSLVYRLAKIFHGETSFINALVVQENKKAAEQLIQSQDLKQILEDWKTLDLAIVGIGGEAHQEEESVWRDLLSAQDYQALRQEAAVGEVCCRFFNQEGQSVYQALQERTIGISLDQLAKIPKTIAVARGKEKATAILAALKAGFINHLVTDQETILALLAVDKDDSFQELKR
ncbi:sugar-binding transcriptional regulator [Streptococcus catagoni]|uniref:sugar-binding transcriptional regulator n=1 Tax=Streptococcus catagoni TaxID=2654874 RepID=UPI00140A6CCF|nr:sugar-binding transcriptional regulator [Streptococcus catagoni]